MQPVAKSQQCLNTNKHDDQLLTHRRAPFFCWRRAKFDIYSFISLLGFQYCCLVHLECIHNKLLILCSSSPRRGGAGIKWKTTASFVSMSSRRPRLLLPLLPQLPLRQLPWLLLLLLLPRQPYTMARVHSPRWTSPRSCLAR